MEVLIQTPTPNLETSLAFYKTLGFTKIHSEKNARISDGQCVIEINPDRHARAGIRLAGQWGEVIPTLEKDTFITKSKDTTLLQDRSGTWIYLDEKRTETLDNPTTDGPSVLGNFAGVSLEVADLSGAIRFWQTLGFEYAMGSADQGWVTLTAGDLMSVSLMKPLSCPHLFFNPSLTYFNGPKNPEIIDNIRALKIPITEEITTFNDQGMVDNIIIRDPGGLGFFIFND